MERQFERHQNCTLNFEDFVSLGDKGADCPMCLGIDPNWHCLGGSHPRQAGATAVAAPAGTRASRGNTPPSVADQQVFILGESPIMAASPQVIVGNLLGTTFAVSKRHLLTAYHNLCDENSIPQYDAISGCSLVGKYFIARSGTKIGAEIALNSPKLVKLVKFDANSDWALLELEDPSEEFPAYLTLCPKSELPSLETEVVDVKTLFAPVGQFLTNEIRDLKIWVDEYRRVLQYDDQDTRLIVDGGLYRGTCGSPYININDQVVAMHLASFNEGRNVSLVKPRLGKRKAASALSLTSVLDNAVDHVTDLSDVHNSTRIGVVLANVPDILDFIAAQD